MVQTLNSPGVSVSVIDESAYAPAGRGTVPLFLIATHSNKTLDNDGGIAENTLPENAGKLEIVSSQRELVNLYGNPIFYDEQAGELNEYGLLGAYTYLRQAGPAYILNAGVDLGELAPSAQSPRGKPLNGTYWLDLGNTQYGLFRSNGNANPGRAWESVAVSAIEDEELTDATDIPLSSYGVDGDMAVVAYANDNKVYEKINGTWHQIGSDSWRSEQPVIVSGTAPADSLNAITDINHEFTINGIAVGAPFSGTDITSVHSDISNALVAAGSSVVASLNGDVITLTDNDGDGIALVSTVGTALVELGFTATSYKGNEMFYATHTNVPTGSIAGDVWVKTTEPNSGALWTVKYYSSATDQWTTIDAPLFQDDASANTAFGTNIATGTLYVQFNFYNTSPNEASFMLKRWGGAAWVPLNYEASVSVPDTDPASGSLWFDDSFKVDIMVNEGQRWVGFNVMYPNGDIIKQATAPTLQTDGTALEDNDIWVNTGNSREYPSMYRWNASTNAWEKIDNTDQSTPLGVVFGDARADTGPDPVVVGSETYVRSTDEEALTESVYVDPDAPNPLEYPAGMLLFNTRYSTNVVKEWRPSWLIDYVGETYSVGAEAFDTTAIIDAGRWVCITEFADEDLNSSGKNPDTGVAYFGYKAQRSVIVRKMQQVISTNENVRAETVYFNLITCPGYPELIDEMIVLNQDKKEVAFVIGDTPARLTPRTSEIDNWAKNAGLAATNGEDGLATQSYPYVALYYPWGFTTNPTDGREVMVPASSLALMTYIYNDTVAYPWFAPAGQNRGIVTTATSVGYLDDEDEFEAVLLNQRQRDILYMNRINPIAYMPGSGLMVYGQKTLHGENTALDRVNVARLVNYLRYNMDLLAKPFLFEPNDEYTREQVRLSFNRFFDNLQQLRAVYDYAVVCDDSNNTPDRIDRNELWIDIAIQPVKAIEFIYIPIRIRNTGEDLGN